MKVAPTKADVDAATTTENCTTLGLFAPSSFDTLTLQNCADEISGILLYIYKYIDWVEVPS